MQLFSGDLFKGMPASCLIDMGLMVARNAIDARRAAPVRLAHGVLGGRGGLRRSFSRYRPAA